MKSDMDKIYKDKIKENNYQIEFQKIILDAAFEFMDLNQENFNGKVDKLLKDIGSFLNVDRTYLFTLDYSENTMTYSNEWCRVGINSQVDTIKEVPLEVFSWWMDQLDRNKLVYIEDVDAMPFIAIEEQRQLKRQDVKSLISVPVMSEGKIQAFIGIESVLSMKKWTEENIELLYTMANILSRGIIQIASDKKVKFLALYDKLTKLPNRVLFEERVSSAIELSKDTGKLISVVFMDLDNFKSVNDIIGRTGGDELLKQVAKSLSQVIRESDTVSRFSGDEFMIMINHVGDYSDVTKIMDRIMKIFSKKFLVNEHEFLITASAGIAIYPIDGSDSQTLIKNADIAMYKAKENGKNQYVLCNKYMKTEMQTNIELSKDLFKALDRDELFLYYQPQIDLTTEKISGAEALIRWIHPSRGMISPRVFIPIAEKNGLINSIGEGVLKEACLQNKKWQNMGLPSINIAVNISSVQMMNPKIVEKIDNIIKKTGLDPKYIELEITESISIREENYAIDLLNKLKKLGDQLQLMTLGPLTHLLAGSNYYLLIALKLTCSLFKV